IEIAPPVPSQVPSPRPSAPLTAQPVSSQAVIGSPPVVRELTPVEKTDIFSKIRRKPEIVKLVSSTKDTTVSTTTPVPTIVPKGMIKPPEVGPKEKFPSIVPRKVEQVVPIPLTPKKPTFGPKEEIDYTTLLTKAKGMKYSLIGWWPLGWSRVITYPDMPAQFWKLEANKPSRGIIVGFDENSREYVAWGATALDGVFRGIHEIARDESQEKLMAKVKEMMQKIDLFEAEEAEERSSTPEE
ncbi:MAG: hypothetical protein ACK4GQ_05995, partial [Candidatus Hadarchaeales archaeon]